MVKIKRTLSENSVWKTPKKAFIKAKKTPPDWVELREIIMKKKSLGFY